MAVVIKLSAEMGNFSWVMPFNSPGGSTMSLATGRALLRLAAVVIALLYLRMKYAWRAGDVPFSTH